jgi:hypothetical protein
MSKKTYPTMGAAQPTPTQVTGPLGAKMQPVTPITIEAQIPGHTVICLDDGTIMCGQITAHSITRRQGEYDTQGNPVYDIQWEIGCAIARKGTT